MYNDDLSSEDLTTDQLTAEQLTCLKEFVRLFGVEFLDTTIYTVRFKFRPDSNRFCIPFQSCIVHLDKRILEVPMLHEVIELVDFFIKEEKANEDENLDNTN